MPSDKKLSPSELWDRLTKEAGLELQLRKKPGRDAELEMQVLQLLDPRWGTPSAFSTVKALLKEDQRLSSPSITVERLLVSILEAQRGFAAMMSEILGTLAMAEATVGESNLEFEFSFDEVAGPLKLTLEQFQVYEERTRRVCASRYVSLSQQQRWTINSILSDLREPRTKRPDDLLSLAPQINARVAPAPFRPPLLALESAVEDFLQRCHSMGPSRVGNFRTLREPRNLSDLSPEELETLHIAVDATDFWDVNIVESINFCKDPLKAGGFDQDTTLKLLTRAMETIPTRQQWIDETFNELLDLLNLPVWKRRYELYSVWVGTRLLNVARVHASQIEFHPKNRVLSFAFGGNTLASYMTNGSRFSIKCEVRSELVGGSRKRTRGIQPDFRVFREDGIATTNDATYLVVECKHYLQQNVSNFTAAVSDYAHSCRYATVLLANHGWLDETTLLSAVEPEVRNRARFIGNAAPNHSDELNTFLQTALFSTPNKAPLVPVQPPQLLSKSPATAITLGSFAYQPVSLEVEWDSTLRDIDLALAFVLDANKEKVEINYKNRGEEGAPHFARLHEDVMGGPGTERIEIYELKARRYEVIVRNFSQKGHLPAGHLKGRISIGSTTIVIQPPTLTTEDWLMAVLEVSADGKVLIQSQT
ncbi:hypothetical protein ACIP01_11130 [Pseudomonas monteilii]|uniref:hypothetical protein n=1 Tax=Pseudomonas monteilii TaxID=76759 RepID=UPI0038194FB3